MRTDLSTGKVTDALGKVLRPQPGRELERSRAPLSGRDVPGELSLWRAASKSAGITRCHGTWGNFDGENPASGPLTAQSVVSGISRGAVERARRQPRNGPAAPRAHLWRSIACPWTATPARWTLALSWVWRRERRTRSAARLDVARNRGGTDQFEPVRRQSWIRDAGHAASSTTSSTRCSIGRRRSIAPTSQSTTSTGWVAEPDVFFHAEVLNVFNQYQLCGCGGTVFNNGGGNDIRTINNGSPDGGQLRNAAAVQPVHDDTGAGGQLEPELDVRHAGQPLCLHEPADVPIQLRGEVLDQSPVLGPRSSSSNSRLWTED